MTTTKLSLTATVAHNPSTKGGTRGGKTLSKIVILATGNRIVATGLLAGKYSPEQAVTEFRKGGSCWQYTPAFSDPQTQIAIRKVA